MKSPLALLLPAVLLLISFSRAQAQDAPITAFGYPSNQPNHSLCEQLTIDPDRKVPISDWGCMGLDGQVYLRTLGQEEFYHGIGHWIQVRTEVKPSENLTINARSIFYSGSISYGYTRPLGFYNLIGVTGIYPKKVGEGEVRIRIMDLERQRLGAGLLIQDRETAGVQIDWQSENWNFKVMADGTGGLMLNDDLKVYELSWKNRALTAGYIEWTEGNMGEGPFKAPMAYVSSETRWLEHFGSDFEVGFRNARFAGLVRLKAFAESESFKARFVLQGRSYENGFGEDFVGHIEHMYTSYDQYDKDFTNAANIFTVDDDVEVGSANIDLAYKWSDNWELHALNEVGRFYFKNFPENGYYFYRTGVTWRPEHNATDAITVFMSNKVLTDSFKLPPFQDSSTNGYMFKAVHFLGAEGRFSF